MNCDFFSEKNRNQTMKTIRNGPNHYTQTIQAIWRNDPNHINELLNPFKEIIKASEIATCTPTHAHGHIALILSIFKSSNINFMGQIGSLQGWEGYQAKFQFSSTQVRLRSWLFMLFCCAIVTSLHVNLINVCSHPYSHTCTHVQCVVIINLLFNHAAKNCRVE